MGTNKTSLQSKINLLNAQNIHAASNTLSLDSAQNALINGINFSSIAKSSFEFQDSRLKTARVSSGIDNNH